MEVIFTRASVGIDHYTMSSFLLLSFFLPPGYHDRHYYTTRQLHPLTILSLLKST